MENLKKIFLKYRLSNLYLGLLLSPFVIAAIVIFLFYNSKEKVVNKVLPYLDISEKFMLNSNIPQVPTLEKINYAFVNDLVDSIYPEVRINRAYAKKYVPSYKIVYIYIGAHKKYVFINGKLLKEGDKITESDRVVKIKKDKVLIAGKWGKAWFKLIK